MSKIRLGFVGTGGMGQCAHLRNYALIGDCEVVAVAELRERLGQAVAARYGVPKSYTDHRQMLDKEKLDGIVAIQPFGHHRNLLPDLYDTGLPLLTEKPLAGTVADGKNLLGLVKKAGIRHYVAYHKRSDPATMWAVERINHYQATGELGNMRYVRLTMPPGEWVANGFADLLNTDEPYPALPAGPKLSEAEAKQAAKYTEFINYYVHQVNLMRHLMRESYQVSYADPKGLVMTAHTASGVVGVLEMATYYNTLDWQESALVTFDHGWIRLDLPAPLVRNRAGRVTVYHDPGKGVVPQELAPTFPPVDAMRQQALNFVNTLKGEPVTCLCQAEEALEDLQIGQDYMSLRG